MRNLRTTSGSLSADPNHHTTKTDALTGPERGYAAVDLGASSGRVVLGVVREDGVEVLEVHRFANQPVDVSGTLCWDFPHLFDETLHGLAECARWCDEHGVLFAGIGIDSWGVDWGYLATDGKVELPVRHYRAAPDPAAAIAARTLTPQQIYEISGIADQPINSALRMMVDAHERSFRGEIPLFTPDVWVYWLTGAIGTDPTIASTSQLVDARTREFSSALISALGLKELVFPEMMAVGTRAGDTTPEITARLGCSAPVPVFRVAGHDTASAFAFAEPDSAEPEVLISCGTWSLLGVALPEPMTDDATRTAGLTNECGASGTLLLRNLTGLWMLQECVREWSEGPSIDVDDVIAQADLLPFDERVFDATDERLFPAGGMEQRIRLVCEEVGRPLDSGRAGVVRAILDSLASSYADSVKTLQRLTGVAFTRIRLVGGGSRNDALCTLVARLTGLPVLAGPSEATAIGNIAIQAWADGSSTSIAALYEQLGPREHPRSITPTAKEGPQP